MSGQPIIFDFTVSIGGMTAPIARVTLDVPENRAAAF